MNLDNMLKGYVDIQQTDKSKKDLHNVETQVNKIGINSKKATQSAKGFRGQIMGIGFAALFGGMALKRVFGGALNSLFSSYKDVMSETSEFNQMTNQLSGAWTFFKFTLVDALMQSGLFQSMITFVINLVNAISKFTTKHPALAQIVIVFMAIVAAAGTLAMILGQPILMLSFMGSTGAAATSALAIGFLKVLGVLFILTAVILAVNKIWHSDWSVIAKVISTIGVLIVGIGLSMLMFGKSGVTAFKTVGKAAKFLFTNPIGIALLALIVGLSLLTDRLGSLGNAFKAMGIFVLRILAFIGDALWSALVSPLKGFITLINGVLWAMHKLGLAKNIKVIDTGVLDLNLGSKVDDMRNKLIEQADISRMDKLTAEKNAQLDALRNGTPIGNADYGSIGSLEGSLNSMKFDSSVTSLEDHTAQQNEISAKQLEAEQAQKEIAEMQYDETSKQTDILEKISTGLSNTLGAVGLSENQFNNITSSTTQ